MGVDLERFARPPAVQPARRPFARGVSVTRLVPEKGVEDLAVAFGFSGTAASRREVTLVGTARWRGASSAMADELGVAIGSSSRARCHTTGAGAALAESDVFVLASAPRATWREQFGFAVVEAMAVRAAGPRRRRGSLDEVIGDPAALVKPHDPGALANALEELAGDDELRRTRGAANRARAEERYDRRSRSPARLSRTSARCPSRPAPRSAARPPAPTTVRPGRSRAKIARAAGSGPRSAQRPGGPRRRARACRRLRAPRT